MLQSFFEDFLSNSLLYFWENSGEMHFDKKHYYGLTLSWNVKEKSIANAQGAITCHEIWAGNYHHYLNVSGQ